MAVEENKSTILRFVEARNSNEHSTMPRRPGRWQSATGFGARVLRDHHGLPRCAHHSRGADQGGGQGCTALDLARHPVLFREKIGVKITLNPVGSDDLLSGRAVEDGSGGSAHRLPQPIAGPGQPGPKTCAAQNNHRPQSR